MEGVHFSLILKDNFVGYSSLGWQLFSVAYGVTLDLSPSWFLLYFFAWYFFSTSSFFLTLWKEPGMTSAINGCFASEQHSQTAGKTILCSSQQSHTNFGKYINLRTKRTKVASQAGMVRMDLKSHFWTAPTTTAERNNTTMVGTIVTYLPHQITHCWKDWS